MFLGGDALNRSRDNLRFTFLFVRPEILLAGHDEFRCLLETFARNMTSGASCRPDTLRLIHRIGLRWQDCEPTPGLLDKGRELIRGTQNHAGGAPWGWKEPNTYLVLPRLHLNLPRLRYIHVVRNGVDTAYSANRGQLLRWGRALLNRPVSPTPADALSYWCAAHRWVLSYAPQLDRNFLWLSYDRLCTEPVPELRKLASFIGVPWSDPLLRRLLKHIRPPGTLGRHRRLGLAYFNVADLEYVESLGYSLGTDKPSCLGASSGSLRRAGMS